MGVRMSACDSMAAFRGMVKTLSWEALRQLRHFVVAMVLRNLLVGNMPCELCPNLSPKSLESKGFIPCMFDLMPFLILRDPRRRCPRCMPHTRPGLLTNSFSISFRNHAPLWALETIR